MNEENNLNKNILENNNSKEVLFLTGITWALMREYSPEIIPKWHSGLHIRTRENIRKYISELINQNKTNITNEWMERLIEVSHKVEERLYYMAETYDDYLDLDTLLDRLN